MMDGLFLNTFYHTVTPAGRRLQKKNIWRIGSQLMVFIVEKITGIF
jgi:hypothetical protein